MNFAYLFFALAIMPVFAHAEGTVGQLLREANIIDQRTAEQMDRLHSNMGAPVDNKIKEWEVGAEIDILKRKLEIQRLELELERQRAQLERRKLNSANPQQSLTPSSSK